MTEDGDAAWHDGTDGGPNPSAPLCGDASLELFGHGWSPRQEPPRASDSYTGRHRASEA